MAPTASASKSLDHAPVFSWHRDYNGLIYTSGHAAVDVDSFRLEPGDIASETRATLNNLKRTLERAGSGLGKVVKITAYLTDMRDYATFNQVYAEFFPAPNPPARTCVEVNRLPYHFKIEIEAIAHT